MWLFAGLGNPGANHAGNRHNIGFMAVDAIVRRHRFSPWRHKFEGEIAEGTIGQEKILALKPRTFMNLSGASVGAAMRFYKIPLDRVIVFHDELDLAPGKIKVKTGGGHAGHNGLRSIIQHCGADFHRVRLGIGHPGDKNLVSPYVLGDFFKADQVWLGPLLDAVPEEASHLAEGDFARFMTAVAAATLPPKRETAKPVKEAGTNANADSPVTPPSPEPAAGSLAGKIAALFRKDRG